MLRPPFDKAPRDGLAASCAPQGGCPKMLVFTELFPQMLIDSTRLNVIQHLRNMQTSFRELMTALHGMGCGGLLLLGFSGALIELYRICAPGRFSLLNEFERKLLRLYLIAMAVLAWGTVLSGAYIVYPWYRARPPAGVTDYAPYPQQTLLATPATAGWHNLGMEWKEHVAWFAPIALTMAAYVVAKYGSDLRRHRHVREAVLAFTVAAFMVSVMAGTLGALINKKAPVQGGAVINFMGGTK
jgi:hypothetical protein